MTCTDTQHTDTQHTDTSPGVHRGSFRKAFLACAVGLAITASATVGAATATTATAAANTSKIYFGVDGTATPVAPGQSMARHIYGELLAGVPDAGMVTMQIDPYTYTQVTAAQPGSVIYTNIVRWADTIAARKTMTYFGFVHEPEAHDSAHMGTAAQYIAAYQHVVDIMRSRNVANIRYVWQMTAYAFAAGRNDPQYAANYYPGDTYVDDVAEDAYNWAGCSNTNAWRDLSSIAAPALTYATAHDKPVVIAEFASQAAPQRAAWLANAGQWLIANRSQIQAAFYFDRPPTTHAGAACNWALTSSADLAAFRAIMANTSYFTGSTAAPPHPPVAGNFTGDGKSNVAVFRPSNGTWYVRGVASAQYGQAGDIPVPGDYAGDGRTDIAVFRPSNGTWYVRGAAAVDYGQAGDIPVPGDYNGDGRADLAVFRPSTGTWYVRGVASAHYGQAGDIPVPGDYNGDGRADLAVFRPSTGTWYVRGAASVAYGQAGDIPVAGDYNGDGRTGLAVYRPSTDTWYLGGVGDYVYGATGDIPAIGDYTGDGRTDIAVFRPSAGTWYIRGVATVAYGQAGDMPV